MALPGMLFLPQLFLAPCLQCRFFLGSVTPRLVGQSLDSQERKKTYVYSHDFTGISNGLSVLNIILTLL